MNSSKVWENTVNAASVRRTTKEKKVKKKKDTGKVKTILRKKGVK